MENKYPKIRRRLIEPEILRRMSQQSLARWLGAVTLEWAVIAAIFAVCFAWPVWWVWLPSAILIGTRQHGLSILGHEGAHHLIARSGGWNDELANYLTCYPMLFTVQGYRSSHLEHHWYLETLEDPTRVSVERHPEDWMFPMSRVRVLWILVRDLTGLSQASSAELLKYLWDIPAKRRHMTIIAVMHGAAAAILVALGHPWAYPLLWLAPLFSVAVTCYRIRGTAEHSGFTPQCDRYQRVEIDALTTTRTTIMCPVFAHILAPYNVSYHIEHHLFPSVPGFNLRRLHRELKRSPEYSANAHLTLGYVKLFREFTGTVSVQRPPARH